MRRLSGSAFLLLAAATLTARPPDTYPLGWLRIQGGPLVQNNSACIKQSVGYGAGLGMWLNRGVGWELDALAGRLKDKDDRWQASETHLDLSLLFAPPAAAGSWKPFLRLGGGASKLEQPLALVARTSTRANYVGGLGVQAFAGSHGLVTLEIRNTSVRSTTPRTELQYLVGLGLRWGGGGGGRSAPAPAGGELFPQRPAIEPARPGQGQAPAVQPAPPPKGQEPAVQPAPPGPGPAVRPAPAGQGPAQPLVRKAE